MAKKGRVVWTCPACNGLHVWRWERHDIQKGPITMQCEDCGARTKGRMLVDDVGDATFEAALAAGRNE